MRERVHLFRERSVFWDIDASCQMQIIPRNPLLTVISYARNAYCWKYGGNDCASDAQYQHPQTVLGLLVSESDYSSDYDKFDGNQYEGNTAMPVLKYFASGYWLGDLIAVADWG